MLASSTHLNSSHGLTHLHSAWVYVTLQRSCNITNLLHLKLPQWQAARAKQQLVCLDTARQTGQDRPVKVPHLA